MSRRHPSREHTEPAPDTRQITLTDLAVVIAELTESYVTVERFQRRATRELPAYTHGPLPKRPIRERVQAGGPGLVQQLRDAAGVRPVVEHPGPQLHLVGAAHVAGVQQSESGHSKPGSRPPGSMAALHALVDVTTGAAALRVRARQELGRSRGGRQSVEADLTELRSLAHDLGAPWATRILRACRSWSSSARVALSYEAPIAQLLVPCPGQDPAEPCGGRLLVRSDASSDVWCGGGTFEGPTMPGEVWPMRRPGCGVTYPRVSWLLLLQAAGR